MNEGEYKIALREVLDLHSQAAIDSLNKVLEALPEKTKEIDLMIFPDQDGEGTFSVDVSLSGSDLYVLNKAIEDYSSLLKVVYSPSGLEPNVPLMDPFDSEFEVNDALCDAVAVWLVEVWAKSKMQHISLPVTIVSDDSYGITLPKRLN